jgi:signal transduction histidine kinase
MVPLENSRFAGQLASAEQDFLKQNVLIRRFVDRASVFREGASGDGLYVVRSGIIEISVSSGPGREHLLGRMEPGDYFGEMAVFDGRERSASATAVGECELYFVPSTIALALLERSPMFAAALVRDASLRTRDFNRRFLRESLRAERLTLVERLARTIVHDFRNPLNVIGIAADIAAEEHASPASRRSTRDRVRKQVEVLNSLMQELLDFTRASQPGVVHTKISYAEFLRGVLVEMEAEASRRGIRLEVLGEFPEVTLRLDPPRLSRVFTNLAQNAFDAMSGLSTGCLSFRMKVLENEVITEVADNGAGIAPDVMPHIFEPFVTFGKAHGTGLGLAICERIVHEHGGTISARNLPEGSGAVFTVSLPIPSTGDTERIHRKAPVLVPPAV